MTKRFLHLALFLPIAAFLLAAQPELSPDEIQANRLKWEELRTNAPERFARLYQEGLDFLQLPPERREQILQIDRELHQESSEQQARLHHILERYADWLQRLPEADRQRIAQAPDKESRLAIVRELREQDWLKFQPRAIRDQVMEKEGKERQELIARLKEAQRQRQTDWQIAARFWNDLENNHPLPCRLADFNLIPKYKDHDIPTYVRDYLMPMLTKEERQRLESAEGRWPDYPRTLVELADRHPPALPGPVGPKSFKELPEEILRKINPKLKITIPKNFPASALNRWPDFAIAFTNQLNKGQVLPHEMWVQTEKGLSRPMQEFLDKKLLPVLDPREKSQLYQAHNSWPDYPMTIQKLAQDHHLQPPWYTLPGPRNLWDPYRRLQTVAVEGFPAVPKSRLREFAAFELDPRELDRLKLSPDDPESFQRLTEAYFQHRPQELRKLRQVDLFKRRPNALLIYEGKTPPPGF